MVNELIAASQAISRFAPNRLVSWHPLLQPMPGNSCYRIWLSSDGMVSSVDVLEKDHVKNLRKFAPNKHKSFPGFNMMVLRGYNGEVGHSEIDKQKDVAKENQKADNNVRLCLTEAIEELLKAITVNEESQESELISALASAAKKIRDYRSFRSQVEDELAKDNNCPNPKTKISVFLDLAGYEKIFKYPVSHPKTITWLNATLAGNDEGVKQLGELDAYGSSMSGADENFPDMNLPVLGSIKAFSLNKNKPHQMRYGMISSIAFPVGRLSRQKVCDALSHLTQDENANITWGRLIDSKELLIVYSTKPSQSKVSFAKMLGGITGNMIDKGVSEKLFYEVASDVFKLLKGDEAVKLSDRLELFILRKMDKARTKVLYSGEISIDLLRRAKDDWLDGAANVPTLDVFGWSDTEFELRRVTPQMDFPLRVYQLLTATWKRDGAFIGYTSEFTAASGLQLMMSNHSTDEYERMMSAIIKNAEAYFLKLCRDYKRYNVSKKRYERVVQFRHETKEKPSTRLEKACYFGLIGLLLLKQGKRKEQYMLNVPYQLGRFLRVADELHRLYCQVERKRQYPPELCGSSMLSAMAESPARAMDQLLQRATPYIKWAKSPRPKFDDKTQEEMNGLVIYWLRKWEQIVEALGSASEWPTRFSPTEKAELFLGFLAAFHKSEQSPKDENSISKENHNNQEKNNE